MEKRIIARYTLIGLFLLFTTNLWAASPARVYSYTTGEIIDPAKVTNNEDAIFNYLTTGVDTYADGSILNADISGSAAITYGKLSLSNSILNGDISSSAAIGYSKLSLGSSITSTDITNDTIVNADINSSAAIAASKLLLTGITTFTASGDLDIGTYELRANTLESDVATGTAPFTVASTTVVTNLNADTIDGINGAYLSSNQLFTSSGTFTAPTGVTKVYITMVGGGGGGGGSLGLDGRGGGGGSGAYIAKYLYTVVPANNYTVTIGAGGAGGAAGNNNGTAGENSVFDTITSIGGGLGVGSSNTVAGTGGGGTSISAVTSTVGGLGEGGSGSAGVIGSTAGAGGGSIIGKGGAGGNPGAVGTGWGAGGGGGNGNSVAGGNGAAGFVLVEW